MLRRLFLCLWLVWIATPAIAMSVAPPVPGSIVSGHCDEAMPASEEEERGGSSALAPHGCIGCAAPLTATPAVPAAPEPVRSFTTATLRDLTTWRAPPETPPPRHS